MKKYQFLATVLFAVAALFCANNLSAQWSLAAAAFSKADFSNNSGIAAAFNSPENQPVLDSYMPKLGGKQVEMTEVNPVAGPCKIVYSFVGGCRICIDTYGTYVKWPNSGGAAYGEGYSLAYVMDTEGLTSADIVDTKTYYDNCECR